MNQDDPLARLRDIHVPEPLGWWPPAPGWWLLAALLLTALALGLWFWRRQQVAQAYRRRACAELEAAWSRFERDADREAYALALSQILRRAALVACPAPEINTLHGREWLRFLDRSGGDGSFSSGAGQRVATLPYRRPDADENLREVHDLVRHWLARHRRIPPRELREAKHAAV